MRSRRIAFSLPALALALAIPLTAYAADETGPEGRAKTVEVNAPSSDSYVQFHGRVFVTTGKTTNEYRWGGTSCGSRTMSAEMVQLLVDAVRADDVRVVPTFQDGQGSTKCLVGFSLKDKENSKGDKDKDEPQ
jgi:hypothetical protein